MNQEPWVFYGDQHFLEPGILEPHLNSFAASLISAGYSPLSIGGYVQSIAHFGSWLHRENEAIGKIKGDTLRRFADHRCECPGGRRYNWVSRRYVARVSQFVDFLKELGVVESSLEFAENVRPSLLVEFGNWMICHRGITSRTVERNERMILPLLSELGDDPAKYDAARVRLVIMRKAPHYSRAAIQLFASALRSYLRFLASKGHCRPGLEAAVPTFPSWKLSALPRYLPSKDVERVIGSCDRQTHCGIRDRAILLLLSRLALRAGDIVAH